VIFTAVSGGSSGTLKVARRKLSVLGCGVAGLFNLLIWYGLYRLAVWAGMVAPINL
jgi:hypothetical protein